MRLYRRGQFQLFLVSFKCITCVVLTLLYSAHVHLIHKLLYGSLDILQNGYAPLILIEVKWTRAQATPVLSNYPD